MNVVRRALEFHSEELLEVTGRVPQNGSAVSTAPASLTLLLCLPAFTGEENIARYSAEDAGLGRDRAHLRMPTRDADVLRSQVPGDPPGGGNQQDAGKGPYGTR